MHIIIAFIVKIDISILIIKDIKRVFKNRQFGMHIDHADVAVGIAEKDSNIHHH